MYKHLFFLDSKTLDWLTPYILVLASDTIAFNVFVLTFVSVVVFYFLNPMLALMAIFLGAKTVTFTIKESESPLLVFSRC